MKKQRRWPWFLRVLIHPDLSLDLCDEYGKPDHGKSMGFLILVVFIVLVAAGVFEPSLGLAIALMAAAFGPLMFRTFLRSRTVTAHEEIVKWSGPIEEPRVREISEDD